jgi:hypothetical protein
MWPVTRNFEIETRELGDKAGLRNYTDRLLYAQVAGKQYVGDSMLGPCIHIQKWAPKRFQRKMHIEL